MVVLSSEVSKRISCDPAQVHSSYSEIFSTSFSDCAENSFSHILQGGKPARFFKESPLIDSVASVFLVMVDEEEDFSIDSELELVVNGIGWVFSSFRLNKDRDVLAE